MKRYIHFCVLVLLFIAGCNQTAYPNTTPTVVMEEYSPDPTPPDTLPELISVLSGYDARARIGAAYKLGEMGVQAELAIPALSKNLFYEGSYRVRQAAAWALGEIGTKSQSTVPLLITVLLTDFAHTSAAAAEALGKIGDETAIPALVQGLDHEYIDAGIQSARSIGILTSQDFPDLYGSGYTLNSEGVPLIIIAAQEWWNEEGQNQLWLGEN